MHWFFDPDFTKDSSSIAESELNHLKSLRIRNEDSITVTDGRGNSYECKVLDSTKGLVSVVNVENRPQSFPKVHLIQALAKGDRDEQALQACVELGIATVTPWQAEHSVVLWGDKAERNRNRWQEIAISAMKQSQQSYLPLVNPLSQTADLSFLGRGYVLEPRATLSIGSIDTSADEITIVVGPEGGISDRELALLRDKGFVGIKLGDSILRTSTAGPAALAAILTLFDKW